MPNMLVQYCRIGMGAYTWTASWGLTNKTHAVSWKSGLYHCPVYIYTLGKHVDTRGPCHSTFKESTHLIELNMDFMLLLLRFLITMYEVRMLPIIRRITKSTAAVTPEAVTAMLCVLWEDFYPSDSDRVL